MYLSKFFTSELKAKRFQKENGGMLLKNKPRSRTRARYEATAHLRGLTAEFQAAHPFAVAWNEFPTTKGEPVQEPEQDEAPVQSGVEKVVVFRSEGGHLIDLILKADNYNDQFNGVAAAAIEVWEQSEGQEFRDVLLDRLSAAGYDVEVADYVTYDG